MKNIYLKRKIDKLFDEWLKSNNHSPLLVFGIRQCGKSRSIIEFAKKTFKYVNLINFWNHPQAKEAFENSLEVDSIISKLSYLFPNFKFIPYQTVIIFDEIQDCPKARLAFKNFKQDGRFEIISSGSYIGLNIDNSDVPKPVGYEDFLEMKTMDFQEFLWAKGYKQNNVDSLIKYLKDKKPIPDFIHKTMKELFKEYVCIGGYPEVILKYLETKSFSECYKKINSLIIDIKGDATKRKDSNGKPLYQPSEIARIQQAFNLIASFTVSDNKRFISSKINGNGIQRQEAINYLLNSSVAFKVNNINVPALPLAISKIESNFKLFYSDISMMIASLGFDTIRGVMQEDLGMNKGFLYEAIAADSFYKSDIPLYFFAKNSGLEIDFVMSYQGKATLVEVKAKNGNTKSSKTVLSHPEHYGKTKLIKIGDYNISQDGDITTIPFYLIFALGKTK